MQKKIMGQGLVAAQGNEVTLQGIEVLRASSCLTFLEIQKHRKHCAPQLEKAHKTLDPVDPVHSTVCGVYGSIKNITLNS